MRNFTVTCLVLNRRNFSDSDRFITVFSKEKGKLSGLAKGVRKLTSRKRSSLELATLSRLSYTKTSGSYLITQGELIESFTNLKQNLNRLTQTYQILEIVDAMTAEEEPAPQIFDQLLVLFKKLNAGGHHRDTITNTLRFIITELGFGLPDNPSEAALKNHIESIINKKLKSKKFLTLTSPFSPLDDKG